MLEVTWGLGIFVHLQSLSLIAVALLSLNTKIVVLWNVVRETKAEVSDKTVYINDTDKKVKMDKSKK